MITEFTINILFSVLSALLSLLPDFSWSVDTSSFDVFLQIVGVAGYLLPMGTISVIIGIVVALTMFRIMIAIVKTIWELLPIV